VSSATNGTVPGASSTSVPPTSTTTIYMTHSIPDKIEPVVSPVTSPTSNGPTCSGLTTAQPKQTKQKKIADIANTLHKRMSDALLTMVTKRAASPNTRKSCQATPPAQKPANSAHTPSAHIHSAHTHSDLREKSVTTTFIRPEITTKQSLQNVPPNGHLLNNSTFSQNNQTEEPLNLVKRDQEIVRFKNGMFILDIPPSAT
jgi:hypothetical protein